MIFARAWSLQRTIQVDTMATTQRSARSKNNPRASKPRGRSKSTPRARPNANNTLSANKWTSPVVQFVTRCALLMLYFAVQGVLHIVQLLTHCAFPMLYFAVQGVLHIIVYLCAPPTGWYEPALVLVNLLMVAVCRLLNGTPLCNPCVELYASLRKAYHSPDTSVIASLVVLCLAIIAFLCLDAINEHQMRKDLKECLTGCPNQIVIPISDCRNNCLQWFGGKASRYAWCVHVLLMKVVELTKPLETVRDVIQPRWLRTFATNRGRGRTNGVQP